MARQRVVIPGTRIGITGTGSYVPVRAVTNDDLAKVLDTTAEAIYRVTGIRERRLRNEKENIYVMGAVAGRRALENAGLTPADIDAIYCSINHTGELSIPTSASIIHQLMGFPALAGSDSGARANFCPSCDVLAGCSGPLYALEAALGKILSERTLRGKRDTKALVIAGDAMSNYVDWHDRETAMVFADGIGAVVLEDLDEASQRSGVVVLEESQAAGILALHLASDGAKADTICLFSPNTAQSPETAATSPVAVPREFARMKGAEVYRQAVRRLKSSLSEALDRAGLGEEDIDLFIPHQANLQILQKVFGDLIPRDPDPDADARVYVRGVVLEGNCSAGTMFVALDKLNRTGRLQAGMTLALPTFGAGMAWGTAVTRWHKPAPERQSWAVFESRQRAADSPLIEKLHTRYVGMVEKMRRTLTMR